MVRALIFCLLGPPLGFLTGFLGIIPLLGGGEFPENAGDWHAYVVLMPMAYYFGLLPAALAAALDAWLAGRGIAWRPAWVALGAYFAAFLPFAAVILFGFAPGLFTLIYGFVGAIPALICSWLTQILARRKATAGPQPG